MSTLICPECGVENGSGSVVCAACGAALIDLSMPLGDESAGGAQRAEDLPDWLDELRQAGEKSDAPEAEEAILPDWLAEAGGEEMVAAEAPDWLEPEKVDRDQPSKAEPPTAAADEFPDWGQLAEDDEIADLLSALEDDREMGGEVWEPGELPGAGRKADAGEVAEPDRAPMSWLEALEAVEDDTTPPDDLPDWLATDVAESPTEVVATGESESEEIASEGEPAEAPVGDRTDEALEEPLPDWLAEAEPAGETETARDDLKPETEGSLAAEEESKEWFDAIEVGMAASVAFAGDQREAEPPPEHEEELPDWISEVRQQDDWSEGEVEEDSFGEWVAGHTAELKERAVRQEPKPQQGDTKPLKPSKELKGVPEKIAGEELPDWLADQIREDVPMEERESLPASELPEWLAGMALAQAAAADEEVIESEGLPPESSEEWQELLDDLSAAQQEEAVQETEVEAILESDLPLGPTAVPEWLDALRPYRPDQPLTTDLDAPLESRGPLTGLRGVIQIEPIVAEPRRSGKLPEPAPVPDLAKELAVLRQLTRPEELVSTREERIGPSPIEDLPRVLLSLALLAAVLVGWLLPSLWDALPPLTEPTLSSSAGPAFTALEQAGAGNVLVAFDYTPAVAGELDAVAETLLRQLASNGASVITLSQMATGLPLSERVVGQEQGLQVQSLGYLPGEALGLRGLATCLEGNDGCETAYGRPVDGDLAGALGEVGLVLVLTDERDSLLNWIEQVQTTTDLPLVAGTTQTLGPVAEPYFASGQLAGAVIGVPDAAAYERILAAQEGAASGAGAASDLWANLGLAQWLVIVSLVAGGLYFGAAGYSPGAREKKGAR